MAFRRLLLALLFLLGTPALASADRWVESGTLPSEGPPTSGAFDREGRILIGSVAIDGNNFIAPLSPRVSLSEDGGATFRPVEGPLGGQSGQNAVDAVGFRGTDLVVGIGTQLQLSRDGGASWQASEAGGRVRAIHFLDDAEGIVVGNDGFIARTDDGAQSWTPISSPTSVSLLGLHFVDARHGWAWGQNVTRTQAEQGSPATRTVREGVLIRTTDGGHRWTEVHRFDGVLLGPMAARSIDDFWMATSRPRSNTGNAADAQLWSSTDAGVTLQEIVLPEELGRITGPFNDQSLSPSVIRALFRDGPETARLAVAIHLFDSTSGSGGGGGGNTTQDTSGYRLVDFETFDGGKNWLYRPVGTLQSSLSGVSGTNHGDTPFGGFWHHYGGTLIATDGRVWRHQEPCEEDSYCLRDYVCTQEQCTPAPGTRPGIAEDPIAGDPPATGGRGPGADGETSSSGGGCTVAAGAPHPLTLVLLPALLLVFRSRRHGAGVSS